MSRGHGLGAIIHTVRVFHFSTVGSQNNRRLLVNLTVTYTQVFNRFYSETRWAYYLGFSGKSRRWVLLAFSVVSITALFSIYYLVTQSNPTIMGIVWTRTGGFAGLNETLEIESDGSVTLFSDFIGEKKFSLSKIEWENMISVIANTGFDGFEVVYEPKAGGTDFFTYSLTVDWDSGMKRVEWVDDWASKKELPGGLKEIKEYMLSIIHGVEPGGIEGTVSDEIGRPIRGFMVSIINGSVGFPEIAVITNANGQYMIGSVPPGIFTVGVHDDNGDLIGKATTQVSGGKTSTLDIVVRGFVIYDYYGGVGLIEKGIYVVATDYDPKEQYRIVKSDNINEYWIMLLSDVTQVASTADFISIMISRGGFTTGGYLIQVKSYAWLEGDPPICFFEVNFTDPGEGVAVTEALTNPFVLVPIGKLSPGTYIARAHIDRFVLTFDPIGKPVFTPVKTLVEEVWEVIFEIS